MSHIDRGTETHSVLLPILFRDVARRNPNAAAIEVPPSAQRAQRLVVTYGALLDRIESATTHLASFVEPDAIVGLLIDRTDPDLFAMEIALQSAGAAYTALDVSFPDEHASYILRDAKTRCVVASMRHLDRARRIAPKGALVIGTEEIAASSSATSILPPIDPASLAYVIYTSGTTGRPKGVMIEHRSIAHLVASDIDAFRLTSHDRVVQGSSHAYDSSIEETWLAFAVGATLVIMDDDTARSGPDLGAWLARERVSVFCPPPTLLLATGLDDPQRALPDLRLLYVGGEALSSELASRWAAGRRMVNGYGPTECTVTVVRGDVVPGIAVTIGQPVRGHDAMILDEGLRPVDDEHPGELCIAGVGLARGYLNDPETTARKFVISDEGVRFYRTGDLVQRDRSGMIRYLGRIDSQVKIRGHRIELEAIDTALAHSTGVLEAATSLQGTDGSKYLAAHLVPVDPARPPDIEALRADLALRLPAHMIPARFKITSSLPRTTSGKLDRRSLPPIEALDADEPSMNGSGDDELVEAIGRAVAEAAPALGRPAPDQDLFTEHGLDSLTTAMTISRLRRNSRTALLAVRDVYECRTIRRLAERARQGGGQVPVDAHRIGPRPGSRPFEAALVQTLWLSLEVLGAGVALWAFFFALLPLVLEGPSPLAVAGRWIALLVGASILRFGFNVVFARFMKTVLIGRYTPRREPVFGSFHVRHWIVERTMRAIPTGLVHGTLVHILVLRLLGARIGRRVHIHRGVELMGGGLELLTIDDDATIAQEAALRTVDLDDGLLVVGPVHVGAGAVVETRAGVEPGASIGPGGELAALSVLMSGETIAADSRHDGIPAVASGAASPPPETSARPLSEAAFAWRMILGRLLVSLVAIQGPLVILAFIGARILGLSLVDVQAWFESPTLEVGGLLTLAALVPLELILMLVIEALIVRLIGLRSEGTFPTRSVAAVRQTLSAEVLESAGHWLSGTLFWPWWLRLAGMHVGRGAEISTILDVAPRLVTIGDETFFADGVYLGSPRIKGGVVERRAVKLGSGTFVGNHAVIPGGQSLPSGLLLGVSTRADDRIMTKESSWFGLPPLRLDRREVVTMDPRLTHEPTPWRFSVRLAWEAARLLLPIAPVAFSVVGFVVLSALATTSGPLFLAAVAAPVAIFGFGVAVALSVVVLKWALLGRVVPGRHGLWSSWCSRWDFLYVAWNVFARGALERLEGTPWIAVYLRLLGCHIGRRTVLGKGFAQVVDPDMLTIDDDATVTGLFQAHTFEDRVLKIDHVRVRRHATVRDGAILFYGADVGEGARVGPHAVVMKNEVLAPSTDNEGCPARPLARSRVREATRMADDEASIESGSGRLAAVDVARGIALLGMIFVHLVPTSTESENTIDVLITEFAAFLYSKSAALFCLLLGVSLALQADRSASLPQLLGRWLKRAAALFAIGHVFHLLFWPTEVLRPIALMILVAGPILSFGRRATSAAVALIAFATPIAQIGLGDRIDLDWSDGQTHVGAISYDAAGLRYLLIDGDYPLLPWLLFPLAGGLLARLLDTRRSVVKVFLPLLVASMPLQLVGALVNDIHETPDGIGRYLGLVWVPTSLTLVAAGIAVGGTILVGASIAERTCVGAFERSSLLAALARLGRTTLSHYVLHIAAAYSLLEWLTGSDDWSPLQGFTAVVAYVALSVVTTTIWLGRFGQGPLEWLLRRVERLGERGTG